MTTNYFYLEVIFIAASVMNTSVSNYGTFVNRHVPKSELPSTYSYDYRNSHFYSNT